MKLHIHTIYYGWAFYPIPEHVSESDPKIRTEVAKYQTIIEFGEIEYPNPNR